jgi:hypothetical protein
MNILADGHYNQSKDSHLFIIDGDTIKIKTNKNKEYVYKDTVLLKELEYEFGFPFYFNNNIYSSNYLDRNPIFQSLNLKTFKIQETKCKHYRLAGMWRDEFLFYKATTIFALSKKGQRVVVNLSARIKTNGKLIASTLTVGDKILITIGYDEGDCFIEIEYWAYDFKNDELKKIAKYNNSEYLNNKKLFSKDRKFIFTEGVILNDSFEIVGRNLLGHINIAGFAIENGIVKHYIFLKEYDYQKEMFVEYSPDFNEMKIMKKIINNESIFLKDLYKFSFKQLEILRKTIYAKHNYLFDDDYDLAYFSLFGFYYANYNSRTKNISLTEIDKQNLKLIKEAEKKAKE